MSEIEKIKININVNGRLDRFFQFLAYGAQRVQRDQRFMRQGTRDRAHR